MTSVDPSYITSMEHFESIRHEDIYEKTQQIDPAALIGAAAVWGEVAATIATGFPVATKFLEGVLDDGVWAGQAANAAQVSARSVAASASEFAETLGSVAARMTALAAAAEAVKIAVVPPNDRGPVAIITSLLSGAALMDKEEMEEALRREAVLVMNRVYAPSYRPAGEGVPRFPEGPVPPAPPAPPATPEIVMPVSATLTEPGPPMEAMPMLTPPTPDVPADLTPVTGFEVPIEARYVPEGQAGVTDSPDAR